MMAGIIYVSRYINSYAVGYLSSHGGSIRRLDSTGREQNVFNIQHMSLIHDMEVAAGGSRVVVVGETLLRLDRRSVAESAILREPLTLRPSTTTDLSRECITWIPVTLRRECLEYSPSSLTPDRRISPLCRRARTIERSRHADPSNQHFLISYQDVSSIGISGLHY